MRAHAAGESSVSQGPTRGARAFESFIEAFQSFKGTDASVSDPQQSARGTEGSGLPTACLRTASMRPNARACPGLSFTTQPATR